jgi:hypothetical protein
MALQFKIASLADGAAEVQYEVHNNRESVCFVAHLLYRHGPDGGHLLEPEAAYAIPGGNGGLTLAKCIFPIPVGVKVESAELPYFKRMEPGERLAALIRLRIPVEPFDPYRLIRPADKATAVTRLMLRIGYIDARRIGPRDATISPSSRAGYFMPDYGLGLRTQEFEEAAITSPPKGLLFYNAR